MPELVIVIITLLIISFICSVLESVILSISGPYIQTLVDRQSRSGKILQHFKKNIEQPISAILTLNTISHTVGAAVSGALALKIFGSQWMALFSGVLTLLILVFSEIIPKTIGAQYWKRLGPLTAYTLRVLIVILKPLIIPINFISGFLTRKNPGALVSKAEIYNFFRIGHRQGVLSTREFEIMKNIFNLDDITVKNIMTPRTVVSWLPPSAKIKDLTGHHDRLRFSRMPLYNAQKNTVHGIVMRRDIMNLLAEKKYGAELNSISKKVEYVPETMSVLRLLTRLVSERIHLAVVINEYGDYTGIVTIEDAIENLLGMEIVDEFDPAVDMREVALKKALKNKKNK